MRRVQAWFVACALANTAHAEDTAPVRATFEPGFFRGVRVDLARFEHGMPLAPGV